MHPITDLDNNGYGYIVEARNELIQDSAYEDIKLIYPHEEILNERSSGMLSYISSLKPWTVVPSILICSDTRVIIDGHHRYYVLKKLGYKKVPISLINYNSPKIITHDIRDKQLDKSFIIECAASGKLLKPKSSMHHCLYDSFTFPVILLSDLRVINHEK